MKNEAYDMTMLAVTICAIAAFVGLLMFTITEGRSIFSNIADGISSTQESVEISELKSLSEGVTELPVASLLTIVEGSGRNCIDFENSDLYIPVKNGVVYDYKEIHNYISGRCKVEVERLESGLYKLILHSTSCGVENGGACLCRVGR